MRILNTPEDFVWHRAVALRPGTESILPGCTNQELLEAFNGKPVPAWAAAIGWVAVEDSTVYDGMTFGDCVPILPKEAEDAWGAIVGDMMFLYGDDGNIAHYFAYRRAC